MERMTEKHYLAEDHYMKCSEACNMDMDCVDCPAHEQLIERLAAYEDTGLTPERCAEFAQADKEGRYIVMRDAEQAGVARLRELAEADKDGRIVVLPVKPGEHVFVTGKRKIVECIVDAIYIDQRGPEAVMTFQCDSDCDGCPFYSPLPDPEGDFRCEGELEEAEIGFERFPKIAFPTREEAEKALEAMKDG